MGSEVSKRYTDEEREDALQVMAENHGSRKKAAEITGIPADTLNSWAYGAHSKLREKYKEMRRIVRTTVSEARVEALTRRAEEAGQLADVLAAKMLRPENIEALEARDLSSAARNAAVMAGIYETNAAKHLDQLNDRPNVNINLTGAELVRSLASRGTSFTDAEGNPIDPQSVIDGQAQEITNGES